MLVILLTLANGVDLLGHLTYQAGSPWNNNPVPHFQQNVGFEWLLVAKDKLVWG